MYRETFGIYSCDVDSFIYNRYVGSGDSSGESSGESRGGFQLQTNPSSISFEDNRYVGSGDSSGESSGEIRGDFQLQTNTSSISFEDGSNSICSNHIRLCLLSNGTTLGNWVKPDWDYRTCQEQVILNLENDNITSIPNSYFYDLILLQELFLRHTCQPL